MRIPISIDGAAMKLQVDSRGEGTTTLLFLHAFPFDRRMWYKTAAVLSSRYRCLLIDLPAFGNSDADLQPITIDRMAKAVHQLLAELDVEKSIPVGLSMGGYVALALLAQDSSRFSGVVLANTRASADSEVEQRARNAALVAIEQSGIEFYLDGVPNRLLGRSGTAEFRAEVRSLASQPKAAVLGGLMALRDRPDRTTLLESILCPVLAIGGSLDTVTPSQQMRVMVQQIQHASWTELAGVGHLSAVEDASAFAAAVERFVQAR